MTKDVFTKYVQELVLPLFTGSHIEGEDISTSRDNEVAQGATGSMLVKPHKEDEYRLIIKRSQPFKNADIELMRAIIYELDKINDYNIDDFNYLQRLQTLAMEKAICKSLTSLSSDVLQGVISELDSYSRRTYEGKRIEFGIIINEMNNCQVKSDNLNYKNLFRNNFFSVISNGLQSCVEIDKDGYILGHVLLEKLRFVPTITPYDFNGIAKYCNEKRIGIILLESGEILIFKNHELRFSKKRGVWGSYCHDEIIQLLSNRTTHTIKELRKAIYFTALDCSFTGTGGCIAYLNKDETENAISHIDINDIVDEKYFELKKQQLLEESAKLYNLGKPKPIEEDETFDSFLMKKNTIKSAAIKECISQRKFHELNRKLRQELAKIDGAIIIDYDGTIIAVGAIVQIEAGSTEGGRLAATRTLAKYGVAIKISEDGIMQAFIKDKKNDRGTRPIFTVG